MARFDLKAGASIDLLTKAELDESLAAQRAPYQAVTFEYLPVIAGAASGGVLSLGGDSNPLHMPPAGYVWSVVQLSIEGLTAGATPDVVNVIKGGRVFWKISGAPPAAAAWSRGVFPLKQGMSLSYSNFGTFAATGQIIVSGTVWQCPEQFAAEFFL